MTFALTVNTRGIGWCYTHRLQLRSVCCKRTSRSRWSVTCWKQTNVCRQHDDVLGKSSNKNTSISATRRHPHQQQEDVHISNKNTSTSATRRQQKEHINISNQNTSTSAAKCTKGDLSNKSTSAARGFNISNKKHQEHIDKDTATSAARHQQQEHIYQQGERVDIASAIRTQRHQQQEHRHQQQERISITTSATKTH